MWSRAFAAVLVLGVATALASSARATDTSSNPNAAANYLTPSVVSQACHSDKQRDATCHVIERFFRAMNSRRFTVACSLLGTELRSVTYGYACPEFLRVGMPEPMPWGILDARRIGARVAVLVTLGQSELDHIRMRRHRAVVGVEHGALRILETKLVA
jgi:hypothetical protein